MQNRGKAATQTLSLLVVTVALAGCVTTPHKAAIHTLKSTTSTTIESAGVTATTTPQQTDTSTSTSIAIATSTVTVSMPDCTASDLTMTARPQFSSYSWNETMEVIVELSNRSGSSCQVLPDTLIVGDTSDGCEPDVNMEFYDAALGTGTLGPYQRPCPSAPIIVVPGAPTTVQVAAAFECGPGAQACAVSHDGNETWDVRVEWQLALGQNLGAGFNVLVVTPPEPVTTTTTAQSTSTTTTSAQSTTTSTSTTTIGP